MRELFGTAANFSLVKDGDDVEAVVEICLVLSEPVYAVDASGSLLRRRDLSQERFAVRAESLRAHVKQLQGFVEEADELAASVAVKKSDQP